MVQREAIHCSLHKVIVWVGAMYDITLPCATNAKIRRQASACTHTNSTCSWWSPVAVAPSCCGCGLGDAARTEQTDRGKHTPQGWGQTT